MGRPKTADDEHGRLAVNVRFPDTASLEAAKANAEAAGVPLGALMREAALAGAGAGAELRATKRKAAALAKRLRKLVEELDAIAEG